MYMFRAITLLMLSTITLAGCFPVAIGTAAKTTLVASRDKGFSGAVSDVTISAKIQKAFMSEGFRELYTKINVEVVQGRVMYTGVVQTEEDVAKAVEIAWNQKGVTEVVNELKVDEHSGHFNSIQYAKDTWITGQIKAKIILRKGLKVANYTVVTSKNIVYLFGIAKTQEEIEIVAGIAAETMGVDQVVSHIAIRADETPTAETPTTESQQ